MKRVRKFAENALDDSPALRGTTTEYDRSCYYRDRLKEACGFILALVEVVESVARYTNIWDDYPGIGGQEYDNMILKRHYELVASLTALDEKVEEILG